MESDGEEQGLSVWGRSGGGRLEKWDEAGRWGFWWAEVASASPDSHRLKVLVCTRFSTDVLGTTRVLLLNAQMIFKNNNNLYTGYTDKDVL